MENKPTLYDVANYGNLLVAHANAKRLSRVAKATNTGVLTNRDRSVIASYAGWVHFCTPKVRKVIFLKYFDPILRKIPQDKFTQKIKEKFV